MTFMNWLPELSIFLQLFVMLACLNFKPISYRSLPLLCSILTVITLGYFGSRTDLAFFDSPAKILISDSLSFFGRMFALLFLVMGSLNLHFHRELSFGAKQKATLFLLFFSLFLCGVFQANSVILMGVCWVGCYLSMTKLILIESKLSESWIQSIRQHTLPLSVILSLFLLLFVLVTQTSGSIYTSDFIEWIRHAQENQSVLIAAGGLILALGSLLLHGVVLQGKAPIALAMMNLFIWAATAVFWFRLGVPFLNESAILPKAIAQHFLGAMLTLFVLRYAVQAVRTQDHFRWLSAIYPATIGFGTFALLLNVDHALPAFYALSLSFLLTFFFVGQAFLETEYKNKTLTLFGLMALVGIPPFILGEQYFRLIHDTFEAGLLPITLILGLVWLTLSISVVQMLGKVILIKNGLGTYRKIQAQEIFFMAIYVVCVISLTALRLPLITLLNDHPLPYLW
jgi:formate hydrogenlyase subunit 3/multisubunit Na+/H+ antiporter MnhD subunit